VSQLHEPGLFEVCADAVSPLWCAFDQQPREHCGLFDGITLSNWPASLDALAGCYDRVHRVGSRRIPPSSRGNVDGWFARSDLPLVYATLGTTTNYDLGVLRSVLDALVDQPANVVVTVGHNNDPADLGKVPENAHVEQFIPQSRLLPHCDLVVSHGGAGTVLGAMAHGLPQLIFPQGADQFANADCIARRGLGRWCSSGVAADEVRAHVFDLLGDVDVCRAVAATRDELNGAPGVEHTVEVIHGLR